MTCAAARFGEYLRSKEDEEAEEDDGDEDDDDGREDGRRSNLVRRERDIFGAWQRCVAPRCVDQFCPSKLNVVAVGVGSVIERHLQGPYFSVM